MACQNFGNWNGCYIMGPTGPRGPQGPNGEMPILLIGNVTTAPPGTAAAALTTEITYRS